MAGANWLLNDSVLLASFYNYLKIFGAICWELTLSAEAQSFLGARGGQSKLPNEILQQFSVTLAGKVSQINALHTRLLTATKIAGMPYLPCIITVRWCHDWPS